MISNHIRAKLSLLTSFDLVQSSPSITESDFTIVQAAERSGL